jgi:hypothetical protein
VSAKDVERGFMLTCAENSKVAFLAEDSNAKWIWIDGLILACNFEVTNNSVFD